MSSTSISFRRSIVPSSSSIIIETEASVLLLVVKKFKSSLSERVGEKRNTVRERERNSDEDDEAKKKTDSSRIISTPNNLFYSRIAKIEKENERNLIRPWTRTWSIIRWFPFPSSTSKTNLRFVQMSTSLAGFHWFALSEIDRWWSILSARLVSLALLSFASKGDGSTRQRHSSGRCTRIRNEARINSTLFSRKAREHRP